MKCWHTFSYAAGQLSTAWPELKYGLTLILLAQWSSAICTWIDGAASCDFVEVIVGSMTTLSLVSSWSLVFSLL